MTATVPDSARQLRARAGISGAASNAARRSPQLRDPEYIAPMAGYLASDDAWNINGQIFHVDGGIVGLAHHPTPDAHDLQARHVDAGRAVRRWCRRS